METVYSMLSDTRLLETAVEATESPLDPWSRIKILVMDLKESETRNDCADEDQQQFKPPTELIQMRPWVVVRWYPAGNDASTKVEDSLLLGTVT
jgi:hypothetical protein